MNTFDKILNETFDDKMMKQIYTHREGGRKIEGGGREGERKWGTWRREGREEFPGLLSQQLISQTLKWRSNWNF